MSDAYEGCPAAAEPALRGRLTSVVLAGAAGISGLLVLLRLVPRLQIGIPLVALASFIPFGIVGWLVVLVLGSLRVRRSRHWWFAVLGAVVMLGLQVSFLVPRYRPLPHGTCRAEVRVMSQNLRMGQAAGPHLVAQAAQADVVTLVETTDHTMERLDEAGIRRRFPYVAGSPQTDVGLIYSRWPLRALPYHPDTILPVTFAQVDVPGAGPVDLAAVHPVDPLGGAGAWMSDAHEIGSELQRVPRTTPLVVAGDFNATPDHRALRYIQDLGGMQLGEEQAGAGFTATWPADLPMPSVLPLDHVLVRGKAQVTQVGTTRLAGTDHRGLHETVCLTG